MNFRAFLATSGLLALLGGVRVHACGPFYYDPAEYYMYRVGGEYLPDQRANPFGFNAESKDNCLLWQRQTTSKASLEDICKVVYKYSAEDIRRLRRLPTEKRNPFTEWLEKDDEAREFLILAKECEAARSEMASPWYYPSKKDPQRASLEQVASRAMSYGGKRLAERYVLQAVRALHSLRRYDDCINLWNAKADRLPDNVVTRMAAGYVAGAYANIGDRDKAAVLFERAGDVESFLSCKEGDRNGLREEYNRLHPDTRELRQYVAETVSEAQRGHGEDMDVWNERNESCLETAFGYCMAAVKSPRAGHKDFWYYSAAFIRHLLGDDREASRLLSRAEKVSGKDRDLAESVQVFRIYLDAVLTPYSSSYEEKMTDGLAWLDGKIAAHCEEVRKEAKLYGIYLMKCNMSFFYWNDMMRKITLGAICPKLIENGRGASAVAFANMADNRLLGLLGEIEKEYYDEDGYHSVVYPLADYRASGPFNYYDYSNESFALLDTLAVEDLIRYDKSLGAARSGTAFFLNRRSRTDRAFFREIIGTRLLREARYAEAARYLALVPGDFQYRLNTCKEGYFRFDPFSVTREYVHDGTDYKLSFARRMAELEAQVKKEKDPDRKAAALFALATGMQNSVSTCWALTFYGRHWYDDDPDQKPTPFRKAQEKLFARAEALYGEALSTAKDRELLADMHLRLRNTRTVMEEYAGTRAQSLLKGGCDLYYDYHMDRKENFQDNNWIEREHRFRY